MMPNTKKYNILIAEKTDAIRDLAQSTIIKNCVNINLEVADKLKQIKKKLNHFSPDLIIVSDTLDLCSKKFIKWLNSHPDLKKRQYTKAKTENFKRLIPPDHLNATFSLSGISYWVAMATKDLEKRRFKRHNALDSVTLYSGEARVHGNLINIAGGGALCLCPRDNNCPPIAEKVLMNIKSNKGSLMSGLPGFPVRIQTSKPELQCKAINIAIKFIDLTEEQTLKLNAYIELQKKKM